MAQEITVKPATKSSNKKAKLILSIIFDLIGMLSYVVPIFGEAIDVVWAPISGLLLMLMYKGTKGKVAGIIGTIEELIPLVDIIPTFTLTWIYMYVIVKEEA